MVWSFSPVSGFWLWWVPAIPVHVSTSKGSKMHRNIVVALFIAAVMLAGCSSSGEFYQSTGTDVSLRGNNYKIVKAGAKGESSGFYLFGFIPIVSPNFADAKSDLYKSVGEQLEGRSIALANQTKDRSNLYLILFSIPSIVVTADIVEFNGAPLEPALQ